MIIALVGNPNCGKTTLFNALTGSTQYVGKPKGNRGGPSGDLFLGGSQS